MRLFPHRSLSPMLPRPLLPGAVAWANTTLALAILGFFASSTHAQPENPPAPSTASVEAEVPSKTVRPPSKPSWRDLSPAHQQALHPLAEHWDELSESHKRKWLALARNHAKLSPAEQAVQHSRMTEWAGLSRQQRERARFNFAEVKQVPADERKAKWEAYQALSDAEKRELAERAARKTPGAAATIRPVPAQKLAPVPAAAGGRPGARIQLAPSGRPASPPPSSLTSVGSKQGARPAGSAPASPALPTSPAPP